MLPSCLKIEGYSFGETMHMSLQQAVCPLRGGEKKKSLKQFPEDILDNVKQI